MRTAVVSKDIRNDKANSTGADHGTDADDDDDRDNCNADCDDIGADAETDGERDRASDPATGGDNKNVAEHEQDNDIESDNEWCHN